MKLTELFTAEPLKLYIDNPGGSWLAGKRKDNIEGGLNQFGCPSRFGAITGSWNRNALVPIDIAAKCKGINGEQYHVRKQSMDYLHNHMGQTGKLPLMGNGKQYAPFIMVWQDGTCWVNEGNHRIMAAKKLGWKYIPLEIRYFSGGEDEDGPLSPSKVKAWDLKGQEEGYDINEFEHK